MKDFLTVKEFSKLSGIATTTLRYWDEIGLLSPVERGSENNYRYYSPRQIILANFITVMSSLNIPLKMIAQADEDRNPASVVEMLERREKVLDMEMARLREGYSIIHTRRELINFGMRADISEISITHLDDREIVFGPPCEFLEGQTFYEPFMQFCRQAKDLRINLNFPIGGYHKNMESFLATPDQPYCFFSLDPTGNSKQEAGDYLVGYVRGYYGELGDLPEKMAAYIRENSLPCSGPVYTMYLHDEISIKEPDQYLAQISVAL